jgi:hypothetical protein
MPERRKKSFLAICVGRKLHIFLNLLDYSGIMPRRPLSSPFTSHFSELFDVSQFRNTNVEFPAFL